MMGIGKNTTSKSMEAGSSTEGKYEDEAKHPAFFTLPVILLFPSFSPLDSQVLSVSNQHRISFNTPLFSLKVKASENQMLFTGASLWEPHWLTLVLALLCGVT